MSARLASLRRIIAVQETIRARADIALDAAERDKANIEAQRRELDSFADSEALCGDLAGLANAQGRRLAERDEAAARDVTRRMAASQAAQARHRLIEEALGRAARDEKAWAERRELDRLIEDLAGRPASET